MWRMTYLCSVRMWHMGNGHIMIENESMYIFIGCIEQMLRMLSGELLVMRSLLLQIHHFVSYLYLFMYVHVTGGTIMWSSFIVRNRVIIYLCKDWTSSITIPHGMHCWFRPCGPVSWTQRSQVTIRLCSVLVQDNWTVSHFSCILI